MRASSLMIVSVLVSAISLSCTADLGPAHTAPVASLSIEPTGVSVQVGSSIWLSAIPRDSSGGTLSGRKATWSSSAEHIASVGPTGIVSGVTPGTAEVSAAIAGMSDMATITVTSSPAPPTLAAVVLAPPSIELQGGATQQFAASGLMSDGSTTPVNVTYSATGGTITTGGLYLAGSVAGSYRVIATQTGGTLADTSAVTITPPPPTLVAVVLTPATVALQSGATRQFAVSGLMSDGSTAAVNAGYSATGGTISSSGLYTAGSAAGSYRVIATHTGGTLADTSAVTITSPPPTLVAVVLTPASVALQTGATQQFAVSGLMSDGSTSAVNVTYSPTGGTITGAGLYTAGSVAGSYRVISTVTGGTLADTSVVTITAAPGGPCVGSTTVICPGESIQAKVYAAPAGTGFTIKAGVHRNQRVTPQSGNSFVGEPGAVLDGEGVTQYAFEGGAVGVLIRDLEIRNYAPICTADICLGAIQAYDARDWTLENLNVHHSAGVGANLRGRVTVRGGSFHHNAMMGISVSEGAGALIEGVDLSFNNPNTLHDPLWSASGIKVTVSSDVTVRGCHAHHNVGSGIWFDIANHRGIVEDNLVTDNTHVGIFYEISYSGVIRRNTATGNGTRYPGAFGAGILVSSSQNVEVHNNTLSGNADGIVGLHDNRGSGPLGVYLVQNLWVHDNNINLAVGTAGLLDIAGDGTIYSLNNRFDRNVYTITGNTLPFSIDRGTRVSRSVWQARGQDPNSTFTGP